MSVTETIYGRRGGGWLSSLTREEIAASEARLCCVVQCGCAWPRWRVTAAEVGKPCSRCGQTQVLIK